LKNCELIFDPLSNKTGRDLFFLTRNSTYVSITYPNSSFHENTCVWDTACVDDAVSLNSPLCCKGGSCNCPKYDIIYFRGFGCAVGDLQAPILCNSGYFRLNEYNNIVATLGNYLDFLSPSESFYNTYKNFYEGKSPNNKYPTTLKDSYDGNTQCIICPPGTYCEHQFTKPANCPQGTYNSANRQYQCQSCPLGKFCPFEGMNSTLPCPQGYICNNTRIGTLDPFLALNNDFNYAFRCLENYFCPNGTNDVYANPCPKGNYCPPGSSSPIPCPPGTYQKDIAKSSCIQCPIGFYCPSLAMIAPTGCDPGRMCLELGRRSPNEMCPPGNFIIKII